MAQIWFSNIQTFSTFGTVGSSGLQIQSSVKMLC